MPCILRTPHKPLLLTVINLHKVYEEQAASHSSWYFYCYYFQCQCWSTHLPQVNLPCPSSTFLLVIFILPFKAFSYIFPGTISKLFWKPYGCYSHPYSFLLCTVAQWWPSCGLWHLTAVGPVPQFASNLLPCKITHPWYTLYHYVHPIFQHTCWFIVHTLAFPTLNHLISSILTPLHLPVWIWPPCLGFYSRTSHFFATSSTLVYHGFKMPLPYLFYLLILNT